jgi:Fanconi anemia group M protein
VIVVDCRERFTRVPALLRGRRDVRVRTASLKAGDYAFGNGGGVERKTGEDFARSVVDGRLFRQMTAMRRAYDRPLLIVEGFRHGTEVAGVRWPALRGALVSVAMVFGVPVVYSSGQRETAGLIVLAARQLKRLSEDAYVRPGYRPKGFRRQALFILQGLPGVGPKRAASLLDAFGSVREVVAADEAALRKVPRIGRTTARAVHRALGRPPDFLF